MNGAWGCGYHEFFEAELLQVVVPDGKVHIALEKAISKSSTAAWMLLLSKASFPSLYSFSGRMGLPRRP